MKDIVSPVPPSFVNDEELRKLLLEGIHSDEGTEMTPEEWQRLRDELAPLQKEQRKAS